MANLTLQKQMELKSQKNKSRIYFFYVTELFEMECKLKRVF